MSNSSELFKMFKFIFVITIVLKNIQHLEITSLNKESTSHENGATRASQIQGYFIRSQE